MTKKQLTGLTPDTDVAGTARTPLLDVPMRSVNGQSSENLGSGASDALGVRLRDGGPMMKAQDRQKQLSSAEEIVDAGQAYRNVPWEQHAKG